MTETTTVAIAGAGPAGLSLGLCLARNGIPSIVFERRSGPSTHPRAHYLNTRTMELFRAWGIAAAVQAEAYPAENLPFDQLVAIGGLSADELARISPASVTSCAQDRVEGALLAALAEHPRCELRWASTVTGFDDREDRVTVTVDGPAGESTVDARWLVAADGAASPVREQLGIEMIGDHDLGSLINVYIEGRLTPVGDVPPLAQMTAVGAIISMDGDRRFCFHHPYDPADVLPASFDEARCRALVCEAAAVPPDHAFEVVSIRPWTMTAHVAERLVEGNVFLVGDAAHAFPPTGGFGMNSGIQDAHNLAWKLAAVLEGQAGPELLPSYASERQPVAFLNTAQSLRNANRGVDGANPSPEAARIDALATRSVRSAVADAVTDDERMFLEMREHAGAIGQDLGFAYDASPVIVDDHRPRPDVRIADYVPNACPGARAPHLAVRATETDSRVSSLLDLFDHRFTLLVGSHGASWRAAAARLSSTLGLDIEVDVVAVGPGLDLEPAPPTEDESFERVYGITPSGAVLVRPDGHVSYRAESLPADPGEALARALAHSLGHRPTT